MGACQNIKSKKTTILIKYNLTSAINPMGVINHTPTNIDPTILKEIKNNFFKFNKKLPTFQELKLLIIKNPNLHIISNPIKFLSNISNQLSTQTIKTENGLYLVKTISFKSSGQFFNKESKQFFNEYIITTTQNNFNIYNLKIFYIDEDNLKIYLLYEYYPNNRSLRSLILTNLINLKNKIKIIKILIEFIKNIHTRGIIAYNLFTDNIYIDDSNNIKITNFDKSFYLYSGIFEEDKVKQFKWINKITENILKEIAPEIKNKHFKLIDWQCDIWSLGILVSFILSSTNILNQDDFVKDEYVNHQIYSHVHLNYMNCFVNGLLRVEPDERPNIFEVIDVFNKWVKENCSKYFIREEMEEIIINYNKEEFFKFARIFQRNTYDFLEENKDELDLIK